MKSVLLLGLVLSANVLAGNPGQQIQQTPQPGRGLTFDQFRQSCTNPAQYQNQRAPKDIRVECTEKRTSWKPAPTYNLVTLKLSRVVESRLLSDKYTVATAEVGYAVQGQSVEVACPVFGEVVQTLAISKSVECADLLNFKGNLEEYCNQLLQNEKVTELVEESPTGRVFNVCGASSQAQQQQN